MTNQCKIIGWLLLICLIALAGWLWYVQLRTPARTIVEAGTRLSSDPLDITSRRLVVVPPEPGVAFSTVRKLGEVEEFAYLILFRYGERIRSHGSGLLKGGERRLRCMLESSGKWAETSAAFELNGKPIEVRYRVELNETLTAVASERLTVEGQYVDMRSGRVFLVDLTGTSTVYRQRKLQLPAIPVKLETKEDAERAAEAVRRSLEGQDPEIKAFCRDRTVQLRSRLECVVILSSSVGGKVVNPNDEQIREALSALDVGRDGVGWAILGRSDMTYLQVSGDKASGFDMEYQVGDTAHHYRAAREDFELKDVVQALAGYRDGTNDWSVYGDWDRITR